MLGKNDSQKGRCESALKLVASPLVTCWPIITEAAYLLGESTPGGRKLLQLVRSGSIAIAPLTSADLIGIEAILNRYADQRFQLADACLMHVADRDGHRQVLTLDVRDFSLYRTAQGEALELLPG